MSKQTSCSEMCDLINGTRMERVGIGWYYYPTVTKALTDAANRPKGQWVDISGEDNAYKCSVCGEVMCCNDNFCPNCGARMDKGGDTE